MAADRFHQAYLLRLWAVHDNAAVVWRASIENIHTCERHAFADLASLCRFLHEIAASHVAASPGEAGAVDAPNKE